MADTKTAELNLLITLALVVMRMAPPDDQKDIDRALDDLHVVLDRTYGKEMPLPIYTTKRAALDSVRLWPAELARVEIREITPKKRTPRG